MKPEQEIHARHILVATEDEAKKVAERLKNGEDFATVAKEVSKDPNAEGGDLGFFTRGQMLKPFEDAAFALDVGQISEPVQTQFGWHIIKVEEKRTSRCRPSIRSRTRSSASYGAEGARDAVTGLRDAAKIEVVDPEIKKSMHDAAVQGEAQPDGSDEEQPETPAASNSSLAAASLS